MLLLTNSSKPSSYKNRKKPQNNKIELYGQFTKKRHKNSLRLVQNKIQQKPNPRKTQPHWQQHSEPIQAKLFLRLWLSFDLVRDFRKGSWIEAVITKRKKKANEQGLHMLVKEDSGTVIVQLMIKVKNQCYMKNLSKQFQEAKYFKILLHQNFPFLSGKTETVFWMFSCTEHIKVS